ncbi:MAG: hypothetical protein ABI638_12105 [Ignavibacteriota bacterium]
MSILIKNSSELKNYVTKIIVISIFLNFVWEMLQMPLYENFSYSVTTTIFCSLASLGDAIMILIIYFIGSALFKNYSWFLRFNLKTIIYITIAGLVLSISGELAALNLNLWNYSPSMPKLFFTSVGLSPVLQMIILPILTFMITGVLIKSVKINEM